MNVHYTIVPVKRGRTSMFYLYKLVDGKKFRISEKEFLRISGREELPWKQKIAIESEYSPKNQIRDTLKKYALKIKKRPKTLVICHGPAYRTLEYLPPYNQVLFLDINLYAQSNFVGSVWNSDFISRFPKGYFDRLYLAHCPIGYPVKKGNIRLWKNIVHLLKKGGTLFDSSIPALYKLKHKNLSNAEVKTKLQEYFIEKYFSQVSFSKMRINDIDRNVIILTV